MKSITRDERQKETFNKWKACGGKGILLLPTGFGKTRVAIDTIKRFIRKSPDFKALVVVPTDYLKQQWILRLGEAGCLDNTDVLIVNTALKRDLQYHLFIADEVHMYCGENFIKIFSQVKSHYFMGLTATLNRIDKRETLLLKLYSVCDQITLEEAISNQWVSEFKQYKVEINVDLDEYVSANQAFIHHFSFFNYDFGLAMNCLSDYKIRYQFHLQTGQSMKDIMIHAVNFSKYMRQRKTFIYDHPKKIALANQIIKAKHEEKIITFTKNIEHASSICCGPVYHSKLKKKAKEKMVEAFNEAQLGVFHTCKALDVGADIQGITVGIILSGDSSEIAKKQKIGRTIRFKEGKVAEIFTFVIKGTAEEQWFKKSNKDLNYEIIQDYQLDDLLNGNEIQESIDEQQFIFIL